MRLGAREAKRTLMRGSLLAALLLTSAVGAEPSAATPKESKSPTQDAATEPSSRKELYAVAMRAPGRKVELPRRVVLSVGEGASAEPTFTTKLPVGKGGAPVPVQTVKIDGGQVEAFVEQAKGLERGVLLQAPDEVLGISTSGHMAVRISEKEIIIAALKGDVLVGQESRFRPLKEGFVRKISRVTKLAEDLPLPEAPRLEVHRRLNVALQGSVTVPLSARASGAIRLALFDDDHGLVGPIVEGEAKDPLSVKLPRAGTYFAVAQSIGEGGIFGKTSEPVRIQALGLAPGQPGPEGGLFLLGKGERVRLAGTDGLEMRYGTSSNFLPAVSSIGLPRETTVAVEFRDPAEPDSRVSLTLAPRVVKSEIDLSPSGARWPGAPVHMRVGLWDGAGRLLKRGEEMDLRVTVNSAPADVAWRRTERGYFAQLEKQGGAGPWVVRVQVFDKKGRTLARDFLEVATK